MSVTADTRATLGNQAAAVLHGNPPPASTGARDNNRTPARSFGDGRDSPFRPNSGRQPRDGNTINNDSGATRLPPSSGKSGEPPLVLLASDPAMSSRAAGTTTHRNHDS